MTTSSPSDTLSRWLRAVPPKVLVVLAMTALVSVLVFAVSELAFMGITQQRQEVNRNIQGQVALLRLNEQVLRAESSQRGYLLTNEERYLAPYESAVNGARQALDFLMTHLGSDPQCKPRLQRLSSLLEEKIDELNLTVHMARDRQPGLAMATLHTDVGLTLTANLNRERESLDKVLGERVRQHLDRLSDLFKRQRLGVGLVVFFNLTFLAALGATLVRNFYDREQRQQELAAHAQSLEAAVDERTQELSELSTYLQNNAERERRNLARDLHDEFGALLTSAKLDVAWLDGRLASTDPEALPRLTQLTHSIDEAVHLKRRVIESLRPSLLDHLGLPAALQWYVQETCDRADLACEVMVADDAPTVPPHIAIDLYRLVQEAVNNAIKYAQASMVTVKLEHQGDHWHLSVKDDGIGMKGFRPNHLSHGLAGMRHRVRALGGSFEIDTSPGHGTHIQARVPAEAQG